MASKRFRDTVGIDPDRVVSAALSAALGENQPRGKRHHPGRVLVAGAALTAAAAVGQRRMPRVAKVPLRMGLRKLGDMTHVDDLTDALRDRLTRREDDEEYYDDDLGGEEYYDDEDEEPRDEAEDEPDDEDDEDFDDEDDEGFDDEDDEGFDDGPEDDGGPRGEGEEVDEEPDDEPEDSMEGESDEEVPEGEEPDAVEDDEDLEPEEDDDELEPEEDDEDLEPEEDDEEPEPEESEEGDEQIAARSLDLGVSSDTNGHHRRDRAPDLFEALRTPHRRAPVMRRQSRRLDPATRPPEPDDSRPRRERRRGSNNPKSTAARP
jgi:hypothetical protein